MLCTPRAHLRLPANRAPLHSHSRAAFSVRAPLLRRFVRVQLWWVVVAAGDEVPVYLQTVTKKLCFALPWSHGSKDTCRDEVFYEPKQQSLRAFAIHKEGWIA